MMLWKRCTQYVRKFGKLSSGHRTGKVSFHPTPKKGNAKECSNYPTIALISHASKVMLKILQVRLWKYMNRELEVFKLGLEKAEVPEIKLPASVGSQNKQETSRKTSTSASLIMLKPLAVWITTNCGKFFRRWEYQTTWPASWEICKQVKKQQLELDMKQRTGNFPNFPFKLGKEYVKDSLISMQSTSCEMLGWMNHKVESRLPGEITITSDMQMASHLWQKAKKN